jgi:hypothetical protein
MASIIRSINTYVGEKGLKSMHADLEKKQNRLNSELRQLAKRTTELQRVKTQLLEAAKKGCRDGTREKIWSSQWQANEKRRFGLEAQRTTLNNILDKTTTQQRAVEDRKLTDKFHKIQKKLNRGILSDAAMDEAANSVDVTRDVDEAIEEHNTNVEELFEPTAQAKERLQQQMESDPISEFDEAEALGMDETLTIQDQIQLEERTRLEMQATLLSLQNMNLQKKKKKPKPKQVKAEEHKD